MDVNSRAPYPLFENSTVLLIRPRVTFRPIFQDPDPPERPYACLQMYVKLVIDEIIPYAPNALQRPSWTVATMPSNIHVTIDTWDLIPLPGVPCWDHRSETETRHREDRLPESILGTARTSSRTSRSETIVGPPGLLATAAGSHSRVSRDLCGGARASR